MITAIPENLLSRLSRLVAERIGLNFPRQRWNDLERGICSVAREEGFSSPEAYLEKLFSSPLSKDQVELLARHLTIGETYFFREKNSFDYLIEQLIPRLIKERSGKEKSLKIWSAGCASGEEPYSIAIAVSRLIANLREWDVKILATDLNPEFLKRAERAEYKEWSFRTTPRWIRERYFEKKPDGFYALHPDIKNMVTFSYLNLAEDIYPSLLNGTNAMDVIFCRNVLMYFTTEKMNAVVGNFRRCLLDGGLLVVSPTETSPYIFSQFTSCNFDGAVFYRRDSRFRVKDEEKAEFAEPITATESGRLTGTPDLYAETARSEPVVEIQSAYQPAGIEKITEKEQLPDESDDAFALYERGLYGETVEKLNEQIVHGKADTQSLALLARSYANQGKLDEARHWCGKAIETDLLNPGLYYLLAIILQDSGELDQADISLKQTLYIEPDFILAHFALGMLACRQEKFKPAKKHFENAMNLLKRCGMADILPESEGITAGRLAEIIQSSTLMEKSA